MNLLPFSCFYARESESSMSEVICPDQMITAMQTPASGHPAPPGAECSLLFLFSHQPPRDSSLQSGVCRPQAQDTLSLYAVGAEAVWADVSSCWVRPAAVTCLWPLYQATDLFRDRMATATSPKCPQDLHTAVCGPTEAGSGRGHISHLSTPEPQV